MFEYRPCFVGCGQKVHANLPKKDSPGWSWYTACGIGFVGLILPRDREITCKACLRVVEKQGGRLMRLP